MSTPTGRDQIYVPPRPETLFPLVRHLSFFMTPLLAATPVSANQATTVSMLLGLGCAGAMAAGGWGMEVAGGVMLVLCYVLDNCDGEIARIKDQCSSFGLHYDSFVDFIVHAGFFIGLGVGVAGSTGQEMWLWMGLAAAAGGTINYGASFLVAARTRREHEKAGVYDPTGRRAAEKSKTPETWREQLVFIFRELTRADFCFIVLGLALFDLTWVLLPAGAIGAQVYWAALFVRGVNEFHV